MPLDARKVRREPVRHEGGYTLTVVRGTCEVHAGQRVGDPALLLVGLAVELAARHIFEQRQCVFGQNKPAVRRGHWCTRNEPGLSERRRDLTACDQIGDRSRRDMLRDVGRSLMLY